MWQCEELCDLSSETSVPSENSEMKPNYLAMGNIENAESIAEEGWLKCRMNIEIVWYLNTDPPPFLPPHLKLEETLLGAGVAKKMGGVPLPLTHNEWIQYLI